jgi:hypothetical protein
MTSNSNCGGCGVVCQTSDWDCFWDGDECGCEGDGAGDVWSYYCD